GGTGDPNVIRSTSGTTMPTSLNCTLNVTRGVVDHNGAPPSATLISPTVHFNVQRDVTIVIEFDELLDIAPVFNATGSTAPILYTGRRTFVNTSGNRECSPNSTAQPLGGAPSVTLDSTRGVTTVTYQPPSLLPGNTCVEVNITDRVRDLAGVPAAPQL